MTHSQIQFDWRWLGIGFCFLIVFHLLPSYLIGLLSVRNELMMYLWLFLGCSFVSGYIGYRTHGESLVESALASTVYLMFLGYALPRLLTHEDNISYVVIMLALGCMFVISAMSAYVGNILYGKLQTKKTQS
jgi:hypothetical protein